MNRDLEERILFEDNHLIIVNKKPSEIVQGDKTGDQPLSELLKDYLKVKYAKPGNVFLGVAHRLDRPVSGIVIFTKTGKALARINEMLRDRSIIKTYWAVVAGKPEKEEELLSNFIVRKEELNKSFITGEKTPGALKAALKYKIIGKSDRYFLLQVELITGRHHQIRAQLAHIGCPIKGDLKYGYPRSNPDGFIHLHARQVAFIHPVTKAEIILTATPPDDLIWNYFKNLFD